MDGDAYGTEQFRCACGWGVAFRFDDQCEEETPYFFETRFWKPEHVYVPEGLFVLHDPASRGIVHAPPFPEADLYDRDGLGFALRLIDRSPSRLLFAWPRLALMWTTIENGQVVTVELLEAEDAVRAWIQHAMYVPSELRAKIEAHLRPGEPVEGALDAVFGRHRRTLALLVDLGRRRLFAIDHDHPMRSALLDIELRGGGAISVARLIEGRDAWDRRQALSVSPNG